MKVTRLGPTRPVTTASVLGGGGGTTTGGGDGTFPGSGQVPTSTGSNTWAWSSNIGLITANSSNILLGPFVNLQSGSGIAFGASSNTLTISATGGGSSASSNALLRTTGGAGAVTTISSGSATTLMVGGANTFDVTLTANCTISLTGAASSGSESSILIILRQDGTGSRTVTWPGSIVWAGGSAPTLSTTASTADFILLETVNGGITWFGFPVGGSSSGTASPLTTKGDLYAYGTNNARFAVGSNGAGIIADSTEPLGIRWTTSALAGELLMQDGVSGPPIPLETDPTGDDWIYGDL